ncbi:MAG: 4Fe-4S dicluster domain-containing protein [Candidatus Latescibacteria bacterium]|jgi:2-oxoglutarate ferredoxin oxidoreductase subunit delta|nr:4Fe-4S dicluster domain-containing protein [Candidatus Latescibacterota bacterium]
MAKRRGEATVLIDNRLCKGTEGCRLCIHVCPEEVLGPSDQLSHRGVHPAEVLEPDRCTGCELCMLYCPELAVVVVQEEVERRV